MLYRFREYSLTNERPSPTRRQVLKMLSSIAPAALLPMTAQGHGGGQRQSAGQTRPKSFTRQLNGTKIHYRQWGLDSAPPLLLLHPAPLNSHVWDSFAPAMASRFRVIAPDARGFGESAWSESYENEVFLNDLHALITELKLRRVVLCGNSMGGTLAYMYAGLHPENVERLILVDTGPGEKPSDQPPTNPPSTPRRGGPPPMPAGPFTSIDDAAAQVPKAFGPAFTRAMSDHNLKRDADGNWRWKYDLKGTAVAAERSLRDPRKWPLWKAVKCPTLVLRGEKSPAMSQQAAEEMIAENKQATLVVIPGAGHFIPLEAPLAFEAAVRKWLSI
jgi:pimeloyl-ACP methyl ester carboxylesterase